MNLPPGNHDGIGIGLCFLKAGENLRCRFWRNGIFLAIVKLNQRDTVAIFYMYLHCLPPGIRR